jgi:hypothetical protein
LGQAATPQGRLILTLKPATHIPHGISQPLPYLSLRICIPYINVDGKNIQVLPKNIGELLTPTALAYWLSGDGCFDKSQGAIRISTESFTPVEVDLLRSVLLDRYDIETTRVAANKAKGQYYTIPKREVPKVQKLVNLSYRFHWPIEWVFNLSWL